MATTALTRQVAEFVAGLDFDAIPEAGRASVGAGFCDCVAVMLAARDEAPVRLLREVLLADAVGTGSARLLLSAERARSLDAALINGTAAHALDFDDIGLGAHPAHPSAVMVPALLALADGHGCTGRDLLTAYVAGYEVWGELALRDRDQHHVKGWHPTGVFGAVAAAAACARLLRLNAAQAAHALAIAASQSRGVVANFGSMTKPLHAGQAAQAGVMAATLARAGWTGGAQALEHEQGLLRALSPQGRVDLESPVKLGRSWHIVDLPLGFKQYPVCYAMHRAIDAAVELRGELGAAAVDTIAAVRVELGIEQAVLLTQHDPADALQAKFSVEFGVAAALLAGRVGLAELQPAFLHEPQMRGLMRRVLTTTTEASDPVYRNFAPSDRVEVELVGGRVLRAEVRHAAGHPLRPLTGAQHAQKFADCTGGAFEGDEDARRAFAALWHLEQLPCTDQLPQARPRCPSVPGSSACQQGLHTDQSIDAAARALGAMLRR
jgi:2-methylcitrate dehydratase PrpD